MNIALLGPSGAGKGTHAAALCARYRLRHVATGDLFRHHVATGSVLGRIARRYMEQGELVPDEVVDAMIDEWGDSLGPDDGTLFDGFPRTADQAAACDHLLRRLGRTLDAVVYLNVGDDEVERRLGGRMVCPVCQAPFHPLFRPPRDGVACDRCRACVAPRPDDTAELVRTRLRVFHRAIQPVVAHYAAAGRLVIVPGEDSVAAVDRVLVETFDAIRDGTVHFASPAEAAALAPPAVVVTPRHVRRGPALALAVLGGPGSGKGTQAARLGAALQLPHIAMSDLFRENLRRGSALGQLAKGYMERGELVPDDVTDSIIEERLAQPDAQEGFILDGFPRTRRQADALSDILGRQHRALTAALFIAVSDDALVERLSGRLICPDCQAPFHLRFRPPQVAGRCDRCGGSLQSRSDDAPATVRVRLAAFHRQTEPLLAWYRANGLLREIPGEGAPGQVAARIQAVVRELKEAPAAVADVAVATR